MTYHRLAWMAVAVVVLAPGLAAQDWPQWLARAGETIFSLEDDSELVVIRHSRTRFEPITRYEVGTSATWTQPVISGNRVFIKDVSSLALWTID